MWGATYVENARYIQDRFQFTHPVWGATEIESRELDVARPFQFTHPVWGATLSPLMHRLDYFRFNSRTPCGVRLSTDDKAHNSTSGFNSRTPCGVRRVVSWTLLALKMFQFTHPVWGATIVQITIVIDEQGFNSRTPCGVRPRCPKVRINRGLDDDELRMGDYEWVYSVRWR